MNLFTFLKYRLKYFTSSSISKSASLVSTRWSGNIIIRDHSRLYGSYLSGDIEIGSSVAIDMSNMVGNVSIGAHSYLSGPNIFIDAGEYKISIGKFCSVARNVSIYGYNHNYNSLSNSYVGNKFNPQSARNTVSKGSVVIGNDVWIGDSAKILSGVTIGHGAVIGAGTIVARDVPPFSIFCGNPAKIIRYRFDELKIKQILMDPWWEKDDEWILKNLHLFSI